MAYPTDFAQHVKTVADIVRIVGESVRLKKAGNNWVGLCPFHQEKTPSFNVHATRQFYYCFGCGAKGDVFRFVMETERARLQLETKGSDESEPRLAFSWHNRSRRNGHARADSRTSEIPLHFGIR